MAYPDDFSSLASDFLNTVRQATAGTESRSEAGTHAAHHNAIASAVNAIEQTLGLSPAGTHSDVAARLGIIDLGTDWSAGDSVDFFATGIHGQRGVIRHGTTRDPITTVGPTLKVSRTGAVTQAAIEAAGSPGTDGSDQLAAIMGISYGTAGEEVQGIGVAGFAQTASTIDSSGNDACGGYFHGRALVASANAVGIGLVAVGRRDNDTSNLSAIELAAYNNTSTEAPLNVTGPARTKGIWATARGGAPSAVAFQIGNPLDQQFLYGLHANAQGRAVIGGIRDALIRDDSSAHKSIWVRGTHDQGAIVVERDAGFVVVGADALTTDTTQLLELNAGGVARNPILRITAGGDGVQTAIKFSNPSANFFVGQAGGTSHFMRNTAAGDGALFVDGTRIVHVGRSGSPATLRIGNNVGIGQGAADSFGGGVGMLFLANATTRPSTLPVGGGLFYIDSGVLNYMGPNGTVTQLAAA